MRAADPGRPSGAATGSGNRVYWQGRSWFLMGANVAWYEYGNDFGGGIDHRGVSSPASYAALAARFHQASAAGLRVLRWWTFVGQHMNTDASGTPLGVGNGVYADFDAALRLAERYDLYYVFNLFRDPVNIKDWVNDPAKRAALADAIGPLVSRYGTNPHILSWEVFNEPEYSFGDGSVAPEAAEDTARLVAAAIHKHSRAYATTGCANISAVGNWLSTGIDFLSPHWYDGFPAKECALCTTYAQIRPANVGIGPVVIGEWIGNASRASDPPTDPLARWEYWYNNGYAGAWAWSLFPEKTRDGLPVDFAAAAAFSREHPDLGPHL